jgi:FkbM family methyltransferase
MKQFLKRLGSAAVTLGVSAASRSGAGRFLIDRALEKILASSVVVDYGGIELRLAIPNSINHYRARTFSTKEPETLAWIDEIPPQATLWDVGANVGLYSCYAAKARGCRVIAFEPSVFNLEMLARNIALNDLSESVTIVPLPLSSRPAIAELNMSSTQWGGALSTFGEPYGHDGKALKRIFGYRIVGISMDFANGAMNIPGPDYIKIDVDGIEHLVLGGGSGVLASASGVLIEINENFGEQTSGSERILRAAGFLPKGKYRSDIVEEEAFGKSYNQIWARSPI